MEYRVLGHTGLRVSAIALGCEGFIGKTASQVQAEFDFAIAQGINFVDIYASNPDLRTHIGLALKGRREDFIIQGHLCSTWEKGQYLRSRHIDKTKAAFEDLLRRLDTDYVDVGMIHYVDDEADLRNVMEGPIIEYAKELKRQGRIRHIGMSSHNPVVARKAVESGLIEVLMFSVNPCYDMMPPTDDVEELWNEDNYAQALQNMDPDRERLYELCERRGVAIDVMKVYGGGDLLVEENSLFGRAFTPVQCIEYALTRPAVAAVMTGTHSIDEMKQAIAWCTASNQERDYSTVMSGLQRFTWKGHCMYCGHCAPCTAGIDIASVNKFYNLTVAEKMIPETVADHYRLLKHHASECVECGRCEKNCPFGVSIIEGMKKAAARFVY